MRTASGRAARTLAAAAAALLLAGCASPPPSPEAFAFGVMGDVPYSDGEERRFLAMMGRMDAEPLAFVAHVGDFKGGGACSDALFARRRAQFDLSAHPFVFTPGDNEWTDCRKRVAGTDSLERLQRLREIFFAGERTLGRRTFAMEKQAACLAPPVEGCGCGALPENRAWSHGAVRFVTLHVVGSRDNTGFDARNDAESRCRAEGNLRWLARQSAPAAAGAARAFVIFMQANPLDTFAPTYGRLVGRIAALAAASRKPVLLVHGDTHSFRVDFPFPHVTRLETFGSPFVGWVKVTVDPAAEKVFGFEARR